MTVLSLLLAVVVIAVLAAALIEVRRGLRNIATGLATLGDALETVECMMEDLTAGRHLDPAEPQAQACERLIRQRQPRHFTYRDWLKLNELEVALGRSMGRPRVKFTRVEDMHAALGRS